MWLIIPSWPLSEFAFTPGGRALTREGLRALGLCAGLSFAIVAGLLIIQSLPGPTQPMTQRETEGGNATHLAATSPASISSSYCIFSPESQALPPSTSSQTFRGCLRPGGQGTYFVHSQGLYYFDTLTMSGTVASDEPLEVSVVGGLSGGYAFSENGTTSAHFSGLDLTVQPGYTIIVKNLGDRDCNVTISLQFE